MDGGQPHWAMVVSEVNYDATEALSQASQWNEPPQPGKQFVMLNIEVKYLGPESDWFSNRYTLKAVGQSGVVYDYDDHCDSSHPEWLDINNELFTGGAITGWKCFAVSTADVDSLQMMVDKYFSDDRVWFDLR